MLKLRQIELAGFKSFYERSEISVTDHGVTAVVGPNGCGKSNISDAVAWVLGEQRARSLRGDRMEDVIFNGTGNRSPLGMAEVTIKLIDDNPPHSNGGPPPGPTDVTVQRRLYRSGESQYLLNGRSCRLRDIQDIFLGTGLGPNSYAIIEQGRIGQLLSARPADRRKLIEEAAGITKFRTKRKLAESRLEAARTNLSRVNDILVEVERQRNSLKRQASKARRYHDLKKGLRKIMSAVFSTRADLLLQHQEQIELSMENMEVEGQKLETRILEVDRLVHDFRAEVETQDTRLEEARETYSEAELDHEKAVQQLARLHDQVGALDERGEALTLEKDRIQRALQHHRVELDSSESGRLELNEMVLAVRGQLERAQSNLQATLTLRLEEEAAIESLRSRMFDNVGQEARIRNELSSRDEMLARVQTQLERVETEKDQARQEAEDCKSQLEKAELEQSARNSEVRRLLDESERLSREYEGLKLEFERAQVTSNEARNHEDGLRHRLESIRELSAIRAYGTDAVQQFFASAQGESWEPLGILADFIEVNSDFEEIVEDLLHLELQYVVVRNLSNVKDALAIAHKMKGGRLEFLVVEPIREPVDFETDSIDALSVTEVIQFDEQVRHLVRCVSNAYIVENVEHAWDLSESYPDKRFITRRGEVVHDRVISCGDQSAKGPLSLKRELRDLDRRIELAEKETGQAEAFLAELGARIKDYDLRKGSLLHQLQDAEKEALGYEHGLRSKVSELDRVEQQVRVAEGDVDRFEDERRQLEEALVTARSGLADVSARTKSIEGELNTRAKTSKELLGRSESLGAQVSDLRSQTAVLDERNEALVREEANLKSNLTELEDRELQNKRQLGSTSTNKEAVLKGISSRKTVQAESVRKRDDLDSVISTAVERLDGLRKELHEAESGWDEARGELDSWKDQRKEREIEKTRVDADLEHLASLCFSELGEPIESVCLDSFETLSSEELQERDKEYQELRQRLDSMGSVNMVAVEEYDDAQQRFDFLSAQRKDLRDSIQDTVQAIDEIDAVCKRQFKEAFEKINLRFQTAFVELFGGGHGELRLIEQGENENADTGIEIVAQPPGKKLQNILLLSGGEKALAALGLLIALFQFKPSPFCVLDEVDAPLDDANIDRFANMIKDMSEATQFIVITHSKRTMETASQLYGVTMEEPGVSKVVSVRLN